MHDCIFVLLCIYLPVLEACVDEEHWHGQDMEDPGRLQIGQGRQVQPEFLESPGRSELAEQ